MHRAASTKNRRALYHRALTGQHQAGARFLTGEDGPSILPSHGTGPSRRLHPQPSVAHHQETTVRVIPFTSPARPPTRLSPQSIQSQPMTADRQPHAMQVPRRLSSPASLLRPCVLQEAIYRINSRSRDSVYSCRNRRITKCMRTKNRCLLSESHALPRSTDLSLLAHCYQYITRSQQHPRRLRNQRGVYTKNHHLRVASTRRLKAASQQIAHKISIRAYIFASQCVPCQTSTGPCRAYHHKHLCLTSHEVNLYTVPSTPK